MSDLRRRRVRAGGSIFVEGEPADVAYVIEAGEVGIYAVQDGEQRCVAVVRAGQLLGEMAILDRAPRSATARAHQDTDLVVVERERLETRMANLDPVVRLALTGLIDRLRGQIHRAAGAPPTSAASPGAGAAALDRLRLETDLEGAVIGNALALWMQPIFDLETREVHGYEALCRWPHPRRGLIPPDIFIPLAEESGLILALGRWMLREACRVATILEREPTLHAPAGRPIFVSVNVSSAQFLDRGFSLALENTLRENQLDPGRLKLEITESALSRPEVARRWISMCKGHGVRISLDDFGTGYSGLATLHDLAIDEIKVDQRFVRQAIQDRRSARVAEAILHLANGLGLDTVCEGVETEGQLEQMRDMGCRYGQGFLLSPPLPWRRLLGPGATAS